MTNKIKQISILGIIIVILTVSVFVFKNKESDIIEEENNEELIKEESVSLLIIEPDFLNPLVSKNKYVQEVSNLVFDSLVKINSNLKPEPALAKLFIPNEDLTSWNITLRDDVFFHDDTKLTADDVIFTINKIKELGDKSLFSYSVENIESVDKVSDYQIKINLNKSDNFLTNKLNFPVLSKNYYQDKSLQKDKKYIGTGYYRQVKITDEEMKLSAFDKYYSNAKGNIKNIDIKIAAKNRPGFELLKLGEIDIADTNTEVGAYGRSAYNNEKYITGVFEGIIFNSENEALKDTSVRLAILLGINRDIIIENYIGGYGVSVDLPMNPNSYLVNKSLQKNSFNPERAQDILTNNVWNMNDKLGCRAKGLLKAQFNLLVNSDSKNAKQKADFIKNNLKNIGIDIKVVLKEAPEYNVAIAKKDYDLAIADWAISEYPEFLYDFYSASKNNIFGFKNEDYDYYVYMLKTEFLEGKTKEYIDKMQDILIKELPIIGLYFETSTVYYNQAIEGKLNPTINNIYADLKDVIKK